MSIDIHGHCPAKFEPVRQAFAASFAEGRELGARFTVCLEGEPAIDLWAGFADRQRSRAFAEDTLVPVFSTTKAMTALMLALAVERGRVDYEQTVASLWPEFGQADKERLTVGQVLSHQGGLPGFPEPVDPEIWFDWAATCEALAAMAPLWPPGAASGYHPVTFGFLAGEIFRRADGRTIGRALAEEIAGPAGLDLWIGLPASEHGRVADVQRPPGLSDFGEANAATRAAFLTRWASPTGKRDDAQWRSAELPGLNGHATAPALARLMSVMATDGELDGRRIVSPATISAASRERVRGEDLVLPYEVSWGAGFMRNAPNMIYGPDPDAFGHSGWGGSCTFADPERRLSAAYVMNKQSTSLIGDDRALRLIEALYAAF